MTIEVAGVDAYRRGKESGWVGVALRDGRFAMAVARRGLKDLLSALSAARVVAIDMPIGLPTNGPRACDEEAREFLGPRRNSVFLAPPREVLTANTHERATALGAELTGTGVSQQAYGLRHKLLELEPIAAEDDRVFEVHPEVSFREMAGTEVAHPKTTWNGQALRRNWLKEQGITLPDEIGDAGSVPPVDLLDAAAAAWSAARIQSGRALPLPAGAALGDSMTIWR
ncbi:MAG: DUF429 domain-containing protein [Actinomycetota bacterium]